MFQGIFRRALLPVVLGPPVHPHSLFQSTLSLWPGSHGSFSEMTAKRHANSLLTGPVGPHLTSASQMGCKIHTTQVTPSSGFLGPTNKVNHVSMTSEAP